MIHALRLPVNRDHLYGPLVTAHYITVDVTHQLTPPLKMLPVSLVLRLAVSNSM